MRCLPLALAALAPLLAAASRDPAPLTYQELVALEADPKGAFMDRVVASLHAEGPVRERAEVVVRDCYLAPDLPGREQLATRLLGYPDARLLGSPEVALRLAGVAARRGDLARAEALLRAAVKDGAGPTLLQGYFFLGLVLGPRHREEVLSLADRLEKLRTGGYVRTGFDAPRTEFQHSGRLGQLLLARALGAPLTYSAQLRRAGPGFAVLDLTLENATAAPLELVVCPPTIEGVPEAKQLEYVPALGRLSLPPLGELTVRARLAMPRLREEVGNAAAGLGSARAMRVYRDWETLIELPVESPAFTGTLPLALEFQEAGEQVE